MLQELFVKITSDFKELKKGFDETEKSLSSLTKAGEELRSFGVSMSAFVTLPIVAAGGASIKLASDMEETTNKINVAFGDSAKKVMQWSETSIKSMGLAQQSALDAAALFGDMGTSMGLTKVDASKMSMSLVQLGADLASFKNIGTEQAMEALAGVFTGETESLKMLGVVMTETNLEAFALTQGITKKVQAMTESEKINLRYAFLMNATKNAQGDFARTSEGAANQMRMFGESMKEIGVQLGAIILPIFTKLITFINNLFKEFMTLSSSTQTTILVIAGLAAAIGPLIVVIGTVLTLLPTIVTGFGMVVTAVKAVGAAMTFLAMNPIGLIITAVGALVAAFVYFYNTNESFRGVVDGVIQQIVNVVMFLWNNVLTPFISFIAATFITQWQAAWELAKLTFNTFSVVISTIIQTITAIYTALSTFISTVFIQQWNDAWELAKLMFNTFSEAVSAIVQTITAIYTALSTFISTVFIQQWNDAWELAKLMFNTFSEAISTIIQTITAIYTALSTFISTVFIQQWNDAWELAKLMFNTFSEAVSAIVQTITAIYTALSTFISTVFIQQWNDAWELAKLMFNTFSEAISTIVQTITAIYTALSTFISTVFIQQWNDAWELAKLMFNTFSEAISTIVQTITAIYTALSTFITATFITQWQSAWNTAKNLFTTFFTQVSAIIGYITNLYKSLISYLSNAFSNAWSGVWNGIRNVFKGVFTSLVDIARAPIDAIANIVESVSNRVRSFIDLFSQARSLASQGINIASETFKSIVRHIPFLADGGIITSPTLAMVGEKGTEAVIPLDRLNDFAPSQTQPVNVYLDGRKITQTVAPMMVDMIRGRVGSAF